MMHPQQPGTWPDPNWQAPPQYGDPSAYPASGAPLPVTGPAGYGQYGYGQYGGYGGPPIVAPPPTNGMAIASLVLSLTGFFTCGTTALVGAILGHVARRQIRERGEGGDGMALAGIIVGWIVVGATALLVVGYVAFFVLLAAQVPETP